MASADLKVIFRQNDSASATYVADQIGMTEATTMSSTRGVSEGGFVANTNVRQVSVNNTSSRSTTRVRIIEPTDVLDLAAGHAFVMYRGKVGEFQMPSYEDFPNIKR